MGIHREKSAFGGGSTEMQFVGPNSSDNVKLTYYLKKKHIFGKMKIDVYNLQGKKLTELAPGKSKGINIVNWNGLMKQPKLAKGKTLAFGGLTSPRVPAGKYKIVMTKGKET